LLKVKRGTIKTEKFYDQENSKYRLRNISGFIGGAGGFACRVNVAGAGKLPGADGVVGVNGTGDPYRERGGGGAAADYKIGEVITFGAISKTETPVTHRIKDIKIVDGQPVYITKGDANNATDSKEVPRSEVKGKVLFPFRIWATR